MCIRDRSNINQGIEEYKRTGDAVLLDVRTPQEYQEGHIPESKNVPLHIGLDSPRLLTDGWIMAGIISIMPLSISLGAVSIVSDRSKGLFKDFYLSLIHI